MNIVSTIQVALVAGGLLAGGARFAAAAAEDCRLPRGEIAGVDTSSGPMTSGPMTVGMPGTSGATAAEGVASPLVRAYARPSAGCGALVIWAQLEGAGRALPVEPTAKTCARAAAGGDGSLLWCSTLAVVPRPPRAPTSGANRIWRDGADWAGTWVSPTTGARLNFSARSGGTLLEAAPADAVAPPLPRSGRARAGAGGRHPAAAAAEASPAIDPMLTARLALPLGLAGGPMRVDPAGLDRLQAQRAAEERARAPAGARTH